MHIIHQTGPTPWSTALYLISTSTPTTMEPWPTLFSTKTVPYQVFPTLDSTAVMVIFSEWLPKDTQDLWPLFNCLTSFLYVLLLTVTNALSWAYAKHVPQVLSCLIVSAYVQLIKLSMPDFALAVLFLYVTTVAPPTYVHHVLMVLLFQEVPVPALQEKLWVSFLGLVLAAVYQDVRDVTIRMFVVKLLSV